MIKLRSQLKLPEVKPFYKYKKESKTYLWEPFSDRYAGVYKVNRNLYKNSYGNKVIFEEVNEDLGLTFRYQWNSSNKFGFVRKSSLINNTSSKIETYHFRWNSKYFPYGVIEGYRIAAVI